MKPKQEYKQLDCQERQTIAVCLELGLSIRAIARALARAPSTVSREINRNSGDATYSGHFALQRFVRRRRHFTGRLLNAHKITPCILWAV